MGKRLIIGFFILVLAALPVEAEKNKLEVEAGPTYGFFNLESVNEHLKARNSYLNTDLIKGENSPLNSKIPAEAIDPFEKMNQGLGFWSRALIWRNRSLAFGGQVEYIQLNSNYEVADQIRTYYEENYSLELTGLLGIIVYRTQLTETSLISEDNGLKLDFIVGLGGYRGNFDRQKEFDFSKLLGAGIKKSTAETYENYHWGGKTGLELIVPVRDNLTLNCGFNYRYLIFEELTNEEGAGYNSIYSGDMEPEEFDFRSLEAVGSLKFRF